MAITDFLPGHTWVGGRLQSHVLRADEIVTEIEIPFRPTHSTYVKFALRKSWDFAIASAADLSAAQKEMTILTVITDLKAGGDKAKLTWLAACGLEFPEVLAKVIEVAPGTDAVVLKMAFVTSDAEFEAATTPNMEVRVVGQPEAARVEKDTAIHFTGTLTAYDPEPAFFLHWDKAKVKEEDIPKEKGTPKKPPVRKPTPRKPAAKPS